MSNRTSFSRIAIGLLVILVGFSLSAQSQVLTQLMDSGPTSQRINIVVFGDGYIAGQQAQFESDAQDLLDYLMTTEPFAGYDTYFNAYSIFVESNETGSDHPSINYYRDTYFNGTFDSYGITRLTTIPPNNFNGNYADGYGKVFDLVGTYMPEYDMILMLFNDTQYGGSGGTIAISSINSSAPEVVAHEIGHSFGDLNDEYEDITPGYSGSESPNTTAETNPNLIKWRDWILPETPIPTPESFLYGSDVGLFEGACYEPTGWYRPKLSCKMRSLGYPLCEVCQEQMVKSQYTLLSPIDDIINDVPSIAIDYAESETVGVVPLEPSSHDMTIRWYRDSDLIEGATLPTLDVTGATVGVGTFVLTVEVADEGDYVRTDPANLLTASHSWNVTVTSDFICGDLDDNGEVNVLDIIYFIDFKFKDGPAPTIMEAADVDGNGEVNVLDIIYMIDFKFKDGPDPACI